ncbi:MAG: hypothetical protein K5821_14260 [Nitrobacter sp.]|uniref:hypothetical protein n=1 Tax=Nitrobacter sp. TaxID=29420 RepID=UPI0026149878|nr:hypothetical protein [Nitrobacter sp.]MCV0387561.1 hypothetical protein [Nitrobacter sp.]
MAQATNHSTPKNIDMNTVVIHVLALTIGVLLDDKEEIRAAEEALANDLGFAV